MSTLIVLCHVNFYMEPVAPWGVPAKRVCVSFRLLFPYLLFLVYISMFVVVLFSCAGIALCSALRVLLAGW